jgi:large subunit ribosomal protein L3
MKSAYVKDNTPHSLTKGQKIIVPVTILECPTIKILSVRFYKHNKAVGDVLNSNMDKELKRKIKFPKNIRKKIEDFKEGAFDNIRVIVYSQVKKTNIKKTPDILEIGLSGNLQEKLNFIKANLSKEITIKEIIKEGIVDIRGVTTGEGTEGPRKRFGLNLKTHKEEKGQRGPGSGGAWHPARVEFTQPMMGQMGYASRTICNNKIVFLGSSNETNINPKGGFKGYGEIKTDYVLIRGSVPGPSKRQLVITFPLRPSKKQIKKNYEFIEIR